MPIIAFIPDEERRLMRKEAQKTRDKNSNIDQDALKMHFVVIAPVKAEENKLQVGLYQYRYGKHFMEESKVLDL